jgi:transcriptional adapter 2-alpha
MYFCCFICNLNLGSIYIQCIDCRQTNICLNCFSNGSEKDSHESCHAYKVINMERVNTFDNWTLQQELDLINQIENTKDVHFLNSISNDKNNLLHTEKWHDLFADNNAETETIDELNKFLNEYYSLKTSHKMNMLKRMELENTLSINKNLPIRPVELSNVYKKMNGYRAARGDFETELNDKYEFKIIADLNPTGFNIEPDDDDDNNVEDSELEAELKFSIIESYNDLIRERYERKKFIKDFGLLNECSNSNQLILNQFSEQIKNEYSLKSSLKTTQIIKFQKLFLNFEEYLKFLEVYNYQCYLVKRIEELEDYRCMGIRSLKHIEPYKSLKLKRLKNTPSVYMSSLIASLNRNYNSYNSSSENNYANKKLMLKNQLKEWFKQLCASEKGLETNKMTSTLSQAQNFIKNKNNPLKIENYPGFDKLNEDEKEFCRVSRIQPAVFIKVKTILITEMQKTGHCSYSRARKIAGIDVNRTRVIHSYMISNKLIKASPDETN